VPGAVLAPRTGHTHPDHHVRSHQVDTPTRPALPFPPPDRDLVGSSCRGSRLLRVRRPHTLTFHGKQRGDVPARRRVAVGGQVRSRQRLGTSTKWLGWPCSLCWNCNLLWWSYETEAPIDWSSMALTNRWFAGSST